MYTLTENLDRAREVISAALKSAEAPAVLSSFGKDSQLLLFLVREINKDIPVLWFRSGLLNQQKAFAKRVIRTWDLAVHGYHPADVYLLPNGEGLTLVREQAFGRHRLPVLMDVEPGEQCVGDFPSARTHHQSLHFDAYLFGYKDSDHHEVLGGAGFSPADGWELGEGRVYAPLRHMTDADVWQAIRELGVPYDVERYDRKGLDPDSALFCTACLQPGEGDVFCPKAGAHIPRVAWSPRESLAAFRQRFGFKEAA